MTSLVRSTRSWEELVAEGRRVVDDTAWKLGDLALEVETTYGEQNLQRYAEEIDVNYDTLRNLRYVAARYENELRSSNLSWHVYYAFAALDNRAELVASRHWTVAQARKYVAELRALEQRRRADFEAQRREALEARKKADREIARLREAADPRALMQQMIDSLREERSVATQQTSTSDILRWMHERGEHDVVVEDCPLCEHETEARLDMRVYMRIPKAWAAVNEVAQLVAENAQLMSEEDRRQIAANARLLRDVASTMESIALSGGPSDEALEQLISQMEASMQEEN